MADRRFVLPRDPAEIARMFQQIQSRRCAEEVANLEKHPIDGLHFATISTQQRNGKDFQVFEFDVKKFRACLMIWLPKKFPFVAPVVSFDTYRTIPGHPAVDEKTGRVDGYWSEEGKWKRETSIRDLCESVMAMLAEVDTPEIVEPKQNGATENQLRFIMTPKEFTYLCKNGSKYVQELKSRSQCLIKFRCKKNRKEEPHLLITSNIKAARDSVAAALDTYLVRARVRRSRKFKEADPEPDATAFVSFFERPSSEPVQNDDLIEFNDYTNGSLMDGTHDHGAFETSDGNEAPDTFDSLNDDGIFSFGLDQNETERGDITGDDAFAGDYSKEEMQQLVEEMKSVLKGSIMKEFLTVLSSMDAIDRVISKVEKTGTSLVDIQAVVGRLRDTIAVQRHQFNDEEQKRRQLEDALFQFSCKEVNQFEVEFVFMLGFEKGFVSF